MISRLDECLFDVACIYAIVNHYENHANLPTQCQHLATPSYNNIDY